jgi:hypothetical protein
VVARVVVAVDDLVAAASALLAPTGLVVAVVVAVRAVAVFTAEEVETDPSGAVYAPDITLPLLPSSWW